MPTLAQKRTLTLTLPHLGHKNWGLIAPRYILTIWSSKVLQLDYKLLKKKYILSQSLLAKLSYKNKYHIDIHLLENRLLTVSDWWGFLQRSFDLQHRMNSFFLPYLLQHITSTPAQLHFRIHRSPVTLQIIVFSSSICWRGERWSASTPFRVESYT